MRRVLVASILLLAGTLSSPLMAADMAAKMPEPAGPVPVWGWTEFYFGLNIGWAQGTTSWCTGAEGFACPGPDTFTNGSPSDVVEGGQFGYRWQMPNSPLVLGTEIMFDGLNINATANGLAVPSTTRYTQFNNLASATGSLGLAMGRLLAYGKGGWAATELHVDADDAVSGADISTWQWVNGWTAGGGLEYMFFTHFSVGLEYNYYQFNVSNMSAGPNTLGMTIACPFCDFGKTSVQTVSGRINIKLWPWGP
jgi:outer membrane immunogenic protein